MELVPRLNAEEIRGLFAPPPWGIDMADRTLIHGLGFFFNFYD